MSRVQSVAQYVSWVVIGAYLLLRGLYVLVIVPLAGGLANPLARDLRWLYVLEILTVVCMFWRPRLAAVIATAYFGLMSIVWYQFNAIGVGQFLYDRSLDMCFVGAIYTTTWVRHSSSRQRLESGDHECEF
jgi:hypothetical protein